jgi:methylated-DNA-[protein]-cysteine S-methyltransferase
MSKKSYQIKENGLAIKINTKDGLIVSIGLTGQKGLAPNVLDADAPSWIAQFQSCLEGHSVTWDLPLDLARLTAFQKKVFSELVKVPFGKTVTYEQLAARVKNKNYRRAVAMALSANPFPVVIPCHRVVAKNGLGGFSCGIGIKKFLLGLENADLSFQKTSEKSKAI